VITVLWKDYRQMCAVKFLKLEDFLDDDRHGLALDLEPKGLLFAEVLAYWPVCKDCVKTLKGNSRLTKLYLKMNIYV